MVFADDERESNPTSFKFLQMAHEWSKRAKSGGGASSLLSGLGSAAQTSTTTQSVAPSKGKDEESDVASSDEE